MTKNILPDRMLVISILNEGIFMKSLSCKFVFCLFIFLGGCLLSPSLFAAETNASLTEAKHKLLKDRRKENLINYLIKKNNYKTFLEIGVLRGDNFHKIEIKHKDGVDPHGTAANHKMTSDEFFARNHQFYDIIFIDGLHLSEQVLRDVENSLKWLSPGGVIVMHDCLPKRFEHQLRYRCQENKSAWTGDVWKTAGYIRMNFSDVHFCVLDMDWGCGILTPHSSQVLYPYVPMNDLDWDFYVSHRNKLLNVRQLKDWVESH